MIKKEKLRELRAQGGKTCVSIYIPTLITGDYEVNRIRWKNACQDVLNQLEARGIEKTSFLKPAMDLIDDSDFWAHQSAGLAGFYSEESGEHHHLVSSIDPISLIDTTFHLSPLLREVINQDRIFVLALSQQEVRFFEAVKSGIYPVKIGDVTPKDMESSLNLDIDGNSLQTHSTGSDQSYHGNDSGKDKENVRLRQYFRDVDKGLLEFIHDEEVPLVLACVEEYYSIYRDVTEYKYFSEHMVTGNPENLSPSEIRGQVEPVFKELHSKRLNTFIELYNTNSNNNLSISGLHSIKENANNKNIDQLLICQQYWDSMTKREKQDLDETLFLVYDQGGKIIITDTEDHDCKTLHAIRRY